LVRFKSNPTPYKPVGYVCSIPTGEEELSLLVTWVEDRKIRLYEISEREPLRKQSPLWKEAFQQVRN